MNLDTIPIAKTDEDSRLWGSYCGEQGGIRRNLGLERMVSGSGHKGGRFGKGV